MEYRRPLLFYGIALFLIGLLTGLAEQHFANVRMALAAHLEGVLNGIFLLAVGAIWNDVRLPSSIGKIAYWALLGGTYRGTIHQSDLQSDSPYNTYKSAGLPPGPIANPGAASLRAAMQPAKTAYLFFVAAGDGSGRHHFSANFEQHEQNVMAYRKAMKAH